ncbi:MAG: sel1 repeat family protein [Oscillospiraceae bacterium]|nr:sel1 repeat family protein [Oscillospiraceae bacterium]
MNRDLLKRLEIDERLGLRELVSELEAKQFEYLERLQGTDDSSRQAELEQILQEIETEITDTKDEIRSAGSALIFDESKPQTEAPSAPAEPEPDHLEEKIESLRQQEEARAAAAEAQAKQAAVGNAPAAPDSMQSAPTQNQQQVSGLAAAVAAFQKRDFATAFQCFSPLAEQDEPNAQHFLSMMYHDGAGIPADWDGFDFWSKKAIANGNKIAMEYRANMLLRDGNGKGDYIGKAAKQCYQEALDLLEQAGGPDNLAPLETYIGIVELRADSSVDPKLTAMRSCIKSEHVKKAMDFCQVISDNISDSYKKKQWLDRKEALRKNKPYKVPGAPAVQNGISQTQQPRYQQYRKKSGPSCGCIIGIVLAVGFLATVLVPSAVQYVKKAKQQIEQQSGDAQPQEDAAAAIPFGTQKIALQDMPEDHCGEQHLLTLKSEQDYQIGNEMWVQPMIFRAGNGDSTASADYILDGKFSTLELSAAPLLGEEVFFDSTHVALRIYDPESGDILSETQIGSDPAPTAITADVSGRNTIRIAVSLVDGGNGFVNLGYTLVRNAYLIPSENPDEPAAEAVPEEPQA